MTPNKQVSPAIRILRGERDASARATHLEAANKKYLLTTNERKQMSTTTNFKRIALVAVAALGLGVLSSVPSNAAISGTISVTAVNGTGTTALVDSTTAGTLSVRWLATANDSVVITTSLNTKPSTASALIKLNYYPVDTLTTVSNATLVTNTGSTLNVGQDTAVVNSGNASGTNYAAGKFKFQLDTTAANVVAGTYTFTVSISPYTGGVIESSKVVLQDVSIVVSGVASESKIASSALSGAILGNSGGANLPGSYSSSVTDSSIAVVATASATPSATVRVYLKNDGGGTTSITDSLTVSIDKGTFGETNNTPGSKSAVLNYTGVTYPYKDVFIFADGTSGKSTLTISTKNAGTFTKSITFIGTTIASINAAQRITVIPVGTETANSDGTALRSQTLDANSNNFASLATVYAYSSDTSVISDNGTPCTYNKLSGSDNQWYNYCSLTGVKAGTANITLRDAATVATSKVTSNAVAVRVSAGVATSVTLTTDKASYTPGEKGYLLVTVKDAAGLVMPAGTYTNLFTSSGIQYSNGVSIGAVGSTAVAPTISKVDTITGAVTYSGNVTTATGTWTTARSSSGTTSPSSNDPIAYVLFYAPTASGSFTFTATGGSLLPVANQVAVTASSSVADNASAALAAVSALAVTVASLKTLITTLTNLVLKIQKKVKA